MMMNTLTTTEYEESTNEELAVLARENTDALEKLVSQNEGFVIFMTKNFLGRSGNDAQDDVDDYSQICRMAIVKAVKNYEPDVGVRFITYAGRIMRNDMLRQFGKDNAFRNTFTEGYFEESDILPEEYDEEYGDEYDNGFENARSKDLNILPSNCAYYLKDSALIEQNTIDDEAKSIRLGKYSKLLQKVYAEETQEKPNDNSLKNSSKVLYLSNKETEYSWKYPIFHKALHNLLLKAVLEELLNDHFDSAQREYLSYRFGLKDSTPKTIKETAEHFNLRISYARKIEKEALETLRDKLQMYKLY